MLIATITNTKSGGSVNGSVSGSVNERSAITELSANEKQVYESIVADANITKELLAKKLGISIRTVDRAIKTLKSKDLIQRQDSDKSGYWAIL